MQNLTSLKVLQTLKGLEKTTFNRLASVNVSPLKVVEHKQVDPKKFEDIPGPKSLPIIGQLHHFLRGGSLHNLAGFDFFDRLYQNYGPIVKLNIIFQPTFLIIFDPESTSQILHSENRIPSRHGMFTLVYYRKYYKKNKSPFSLGLLGQGENWRQFRSTINPVLMQPKAIKLYKNALEEVAEDTITRLKLLRDENNTIRGNFEELMGLWSLESVAAVALGVRINCLDPALRDDSPAKKLIKCAHDVFAIANEQDRRVNLWKYYPTRGFKEAMKVYEDMDDVTKYYVDIGTENYKSRRNTNEEHKGILERLMEIDADIAHNMVCDMLVAGIATTANVLVAALYLLATNPEKQIKLRERLFSYHDTSVYLKACIKESMRMMPPIGVNNRETTKEYNILGYHVPKGKTVLFCHQHMTLMEKNYRRPNEFIPERWTVDASDPLYYGNAHPFTFAPFGFGVRSCAGRRIAELEVETFLARLIRNFYVDWTGPPPAVNYSHINCIKGPFRFTFEDV